LNQVIAKHVLPLIEKPNKYTRLVVRSAVRPKIIGFAWCATEWGVVDTKMLMPSSIFKRQAISSVWIYKLNVFGTISLTAFAIV